MPTEVTPRNIKVNLNDIRDQLVKRGRPHQQRVPAPTSLREHRMREMYASQADAQLCSEHGLVVSPLGLCGKCK